MYGKNELPPPHQTPFIILLWDQIKDFIILVLLAASVVSLAIEEVNGAPALVARTGETIISIVTFLFDGGRIVEMNSVVNPDKLAFAQRQVGRT